MIFMHSAWHFYDLLTWRILANSLVRFIPCNYQAWNRKYILKKLLTDIKTFTNFNSHHIIELRKVSFNLISTFLNFFPQNTCTYNPAYLTLIKAVKCFPLQLSIFSLIPTPSLIYLLSNIAHFVGQRRLPYNKQLFKHLPPKWHKI